MADPQKRKYTTITIPTPLFNKLKRKIEPTGFSSVSDYATYILRETVAEMELESGPGGKEGRGRGADSVIRKLNALGYA